MEPKLKNIKIAECAMEAKTVSLFRNRKNGYSIVIARYLRRRPTIMRLSSQRVAVAEYVDCVESTISNFLS